mmetsp:Transcript_7346/g.8425  ORF Transcript_7346/g.8425 Transcript_7346/m.8425 type:complete len:214 (-) Transcript_7346:1172-1813(-)
MSSPPMKMQASPVKREAFLQISSGQKWKRKYLILGNNGKLTFADGKRGKRTEIVLTSKSQVSQLPSSEVGGEYGFLISTPGQSDKFAIKSKSKREALDWYKEVKGALELAKQYRMSARKAELEGRSLGKKGSVQDLIDAGRAYGSNKPKKKGKEKRNMRQVLTEQEGWVMKVGKSKTAGDYFVNAKTWEYFNSKEDCEDGKAPVGKALLSLLV